MTKLGRRIGDFAGPLLIIAISVSCGLVVGFVVASSN